MSTNPLVKWSQKDTYIGLIIDVIDPKKDSLVVKLTDSAVHFEGKWGNSGEGPIGMQYYLYSLPENRTIRGFSF